MTTTRRYVFAHPGTFLMENGHQVVAATLGEWAEDKWWLREPDIQGEALGVLSFSFVVSAEDQWLCHRRAVNLARHCYRKMGLPVRLVPNPLWSPMPPHANRGRSRIPKDREAAPTATI